MNSALPDLEIYQEVTDPSMRLADIVTTVMEGYADRQALAWRAVEPVTDSDGETTAEMLPEFHTITYRELWTNVRAAVTGLRGGAAAPVVIGDRVALLGAVGVDYAVADLALAVSGAVAVPLQLGAPSEEWQLIVAETQPSVLCVDIEHLPDAVDLAFLVNPPREIVVLDYTPAISAHRAAITEAEAYLATAGLATVVETMAALMERGAAMKPVPLYVPDDRETTNVILYTSGASDHPKGVMLSEKVVAQHWGIVAGGLLGAMSEVPVISLCTFPPNHIAGRVSLQTTLTAGGTACFRSSLDDETLFADLSIIRPTHLLLPARTWQFIHDRVVLEVQDHIAEEGRGCDRAAVESATKEEFLRTVVGGRQMSAVVTASAVTPHLREWVEDLLAIPLTDLYASAEAGVIAVDSVIVHPPVTEYRVVDLPEHGYSTSDRPHPRGELVIKSNQMFQGYYERCELTTRALDGDGWYHTGDVVAQTAPGIIEYVGRKDEVVRTSHGEPVAPTSVETTLVRNEFIHQAYVYGTSAQPHLLAVLVPSAAAMARARGDATTLKPLLAVAVQDATRDAELQPHEIPIDFIVEATPFAVGNGLLTGSGNARRPQLKLAYGQALDALYDEIAQVQRRQIKLEQLRHNGKHAPVIETVCKAAEVLLMRGGATVKPDACPSELDADYPSVLRFVALLREIFDVDVPMSLVNCPSADMASIAGRITALQRNRSQPSVLANVHSNADFLAADELVPDKFFDSGELNSATFLPTAGQPVATILLTGATGFLGRRLVMNCLEYANQVDGQLICLVRGRDDAHAGQRLSRAFDTADSGVFDRYTELSDGHLEVIAGDKAEPRLGLDGDTWLRLADSVDLIIDAAALVNCLMPYRELFETNVIGTAELIRLALTSTRKPIAYVSSVMVGDPLAAEDFTEDADIRDISAMREVVDDSYGNGYANSKWASEVLLRTAHDVYDLSISVFRCGAILGDDSVGGHVHLSDPFTRLILSLSATRVAPSSFYELDAVGKPQQAHYSGLPVGFVARAITTLALQNSEDSFVTYHVTNPHGDAISLDTFVDWLVDDGVELTRIQRYDDWFHRFETALQRLSARQRQVSLLPILSEYRKPGLPLNGSAVVSRRFKSAVSALGIDGEIPHITPEIVGVYVAELRRQRLF